MSKKKAFSGNTMTLKDFHGGSIPTDLALPSAPGVIVRPTDRSAYDKPTSWGNPMGRPDHRMRPSSSSGTRHFDDKTPFLTQAAHIGRNFDEDERKPLDGVSVPRKTVSDDSFRVSSSGLELKSESASVGRVSGRHVSAPVSQVSGGTVTSYSGRVAEATRVGAGAQNLGGNNGQAVSGSHPNVWAARKEVAVSLSEPLQSSVSERSAVMKLAHASALDKVSSGRWQSKLSVPYQTDAEVIRSSEKESGLHSKELDKNLYNRMDPLGGREYSDATLARHMERNLNIENMMPGGRKETLEYERSQGSYLEFKERKEGIHGEGQPTGTSGKLPASEVQPVLPSEASDRPKLKLLPRTKPLDTSEGPVLDCKQVSQWSSESAHSHVETGYEPHRNANPTKPGLAGSESGNQTMERPKLNLKPRSQSVEQVEVITEKERNALFGGARPRELVLKERGTGDVPISSPEPGQHHDRVKNNFPKGEKVPEEAVSSRRGERADNTSVDQRTGRKAERRLDVEKVDTQRRNWRSENWRSGRETDRQQQQERQPSPETWRRPVEQPIPASPDAAGVRYGKAASAMELAQAFSRSVSDQKADERYPSQRSLPGQTQIPFSRLMGPTPRPQINGY